MDTLSRGHEWNSTRVDWLADRRLQSGVQRPIGHCHSLSNTLSIVIGHVLTFCAGHCVVVLSDCDGFPCRLSASAIAACEDFGLDGRFVMVDGGGTGRSPSDQDGK